MLQGLSATQVEEFVEHNSSSQDVASIVLGALRRRRALRRLVARPLFLLMLLNVVERTGDVPETQALIIRAFLRGLLQRERERNAEFVPDEFYVLMQGFAFEGHRRNGGNAAMPLAEAVAVLGTRRTDLGLTANLVATLHHAVELGLLSEDDGRYNFVHQVFQDYFVAEELAARGEAK
jgi:predicted NACHT family NTPase